MTKGKARQAAKIAAVLLMGISATCAVAADDKSAAAQPAPVVAKAAADTDKAADGSPTWMLVLAGVGVIGWAALRRLGQR